MDVLGLLFSFNGRVGRLAYFAASLTTAIVVSAIAAFLAVTFFVSVFSGLSHALLIAALPLLAVIVLLWAVSSWVAAALAVKRLRDMGRSPGHALWIVGAYAVAALDATFIVTAASVAGWVWLVATPGRHADLIIEDGSATSSKGRFAGA